MPAIDTPNDGFDLTARWVKLTHLTASAVVSTIVDTPAPPTNWSRCSQLGTCTSRTTTTSQEL